MVTSNDNKLVFENEFKGLSTDDKPTSAPVSALFLELDTGDFYYFAGTEWLKVGG